MSFSRSCITTSTSANLSFLAVFFEVLVGYPKVCYTLDNILFGLAEDNLFKVEALALRETEAF